MLRVFLASVLLSSCLSQDVSVQETRDSLGNENEFISINLQRRDENIQLIAQVSFNVHQGIVHLNNNPLTHNVVNHIHIRLLVAVVENGIKKESVMKATQLRVLVVESTNSNGEKVFKVEEEFVRIEDYDVVQVEVQQIIFESEVKKPITTILLEESTIHQRPVEYDQHVVIDDEGLRPKISDDHHYGDTWHNINCKSHKDHHGDDETGDNKHHHRSNVRCWYRRLSWKSKVALFAIGFLGLMTVVLFCTLCSRRRQARRKVRTKNVAFHRRKVLSKDVNVKIQEKGTSQDVDVKNQLFEVTAPMDDTIAVDMEDVPAKKEEEEKKKDDYEFHFDLDTSPIVVSDKQALVSDQD